MTTQALQSDRGRLARHEHRKVREDRGEEATLEGSEDRGEEATLEGPEGRAKEATFERVVRAALRSASLALSACGTPAVPVLTVPQIN